MDRDYKKLIEILLHHSRFVLTTHVNPDGDGLGSELALAYFLGKLGKQATIINHSVTPDFFEFLDPESSIQKFVPQKHAQVVRDTEVIIILDTNQPARLRSLEKSVVESPALRVVIDHHLDPHPFAHHFLIDEDATSTGEIIYKLISGIDRTLMDKRIGDLLYAAIMTDTGSFRYPRTDSETHTILAHLLDLGADPTNIYAQIYETWSPGRMRLLGEALDSIKLLYNGKLAYMICSQQMFRETGTTEVETDNFTTYPMSVKGVVVGILINELENGTKISFRSKGDIPINELAKEFGGGGHKNAAGARLFDKSLDETIQAVIARAEKYMQPTG